MQRVTCPTCAAILKVDDSAIGKKANCPRCKHPFTLSAMTAPVGTESKAPASERASGQVRPATAEAPEEIMNLTIDDMAPVDNLEVVEEPIAIDQLDVVEPELPAPRKPRPKRRRRRANRDDDDAYSVDIFSFFTAGRISGLAIMFFGFVILVCGSLNTDMSAKAASNAAYRTGQTIGMITVLGVIAGGAYRVLRG